MEDTIRRTVPRRNSVSQRRRIKPAYTYKVLRKILVQLMLSGIILIFILAINNSGITVSNKLNSHVDNYLNKSMDFNIFYKSISDFAAYTYGRGKALLDKQLKAPVTKPEDTAKDTEKNTKTSIVPNENDAKPAEKPKTENLVEQSTSKLQIKNPVLSSINSADIDIKSLRQRYLFVEPVKGGISSPFGLRVHPITGKTEFHPGLDIKAAAGTSIAAALGGKVLEARESTTLGYFVKILSENEVTTVYAHCSKLLVKKGQTVKRGQKIAQSGSTGLSNGPHLHFEIWREGRPVDPSAILSYYSKQ